ncbi:GNAT family N-acetyltransferase [Photobacterium kasasachensis]|uniref:GNAT family N-acetyltransferase n=1 Tax=Photobacterium kasasachensis TaxID=2910240 RepID=UPI003D0F993F
MAKFKLHFRPVALPDDLPFLSAVYASTRSEELAITGWPQEQINQFLDMQFFAQHQYYQQQYTAASYNIILNEEDAIGRLYTDVREDEIRIIDIALLPQYRNMGIGRTLLQDVIERATRLEKCVRIHVEKNNPALALYLDLGFQQVEDKEVYSLMEYRHCNTENKS